MNEMVVIRDWASIEEVPDLLDVWRSSVEGGRDFLSAADIDAAAAALEVVYSQQVTVKVALIGPEIVGFAAWSERQIELLWVSHHYRQRGIGGALLDNVVSSTPSIGIRINAQNQASLAFFSNHGFEVERPASPLESAARIWLNHVQVGDVAR